MLECVPVPAQAWGAKRLSNAVQSPKWALTMCWPRLRFPSLAFHRAGGTTRLRRRRFGVAVAAWMLLAACHGPAPSDAERPTAAEPAEQLDRKPLRPSNRLLEEGDAVPEFEAIAHTGQLVKLTAFLDAAVVVYFYEQDGAAGCTLQAEQIRDAWLELKPHVSMVFGVSADDGVSHRAFATEYRLPFLLLQDTEHELARAFGVPVEGGQAQRTTFIVAKDGKIARVFREVNPEGHAAELMAALRQLGDS